MGEVLNVDIPSGDLILEGRLRTAGSGQMAGGSPAAVICHPHPRFGGSMDNNVVFALEEHLARHGISTLSFNFRGVGGSRGSWDNMKGEVDDAVSALMFLAKRPEVDAAKAGLAGYSFGGLMALYACARIIKDINETCPEPAAGNQFRPRALALVSPMPPMGGWANDERLKGLYDEPLLTLVIAGTADRFCPVNSAKDLAMQIGPDARLVVVEGADHFYLGNEDDAGAHAADFIKGPLGR